MFENHCYRVLKDLERKGHGCLFHLLYPVEGEAWAGWHKDPKQWKWNCILGRHDQCTCLWPGGKHAFISLFSLGFSNYWSWKAWAWKDHTSSSSLEKYLMQLKVKLNIAGKKSFWWEFGRCDKRFLDLFIPGKLRGLSWTVVTPQQRVWFETSFFLKNKFIYLLIIYLFLAALGLRCCARAFSSCGERGLLFVVVSELLIAVASLVAEHGL